MLAKNRPRQNPKPGSPASLRARKLKSRCDSVAKLLKVLSHPQRLLILCSLAEGPKTVSELEVNCAASQSAISQYLKAMRLEGLVESHRDGQFVVCRIKEEKVLRLMSAMQTIFCSD